MKTGENGKGGGKQRRQDHTALSRTWDRGGGSSSNRLELVGVQRCADSSKMG